MTRTWKCPQCGYTQEITYDWLVEHGGPVCPNCDDDMELLPENAQNQVEQLVDKAEASNLETEDLDDLVHELSANIAADVNNEGMDGQIAFLVREMGSQAVEKQLDKLIAGKQPDKE